MLKTTIFWKLLPIYGRSREGLDKTFTSFHKQSHSQGESDQIVRSLSVPSRSLSIREHSHSLQGERGMGQLAHFISLVLSPSLQEREGLDKTFTSFHVLPFGLRPEAVILDRAVFASLSRGQSNPLRGFSSTSFSLETKSEALRLRFSFQRRERDSNPRSCDRLRISRPAHSTTLASLRGLHNIV